MSFASQTKVPIGRSQDEIRKLLQKYGANGFAFGEQANFALVTFEMKGRRIRFIVKMPEAPSRSSTQESVRTYEQVCRSKWRAITLVVKAKLESIDTGIETFEDAFMAHIVLPNGNTLGKVILPQLNKSYADGDMPPLLGYES